VVLLLLSKLAGGFAWVADLQDLQSLQAMAWMAKPSVAWPARESRVTCRPFAPYTGRCHGQGHPQRPCGKWPPFGAGGGRRRAEARVTIGQDLACRAGVGPTDGRFAEKRPL
jgi:hypothetical protein